MHYFFRIKNPQHISSETFKSKNKTKNNWYWEANSSHKFGTYLRSYEITEKFDNILSTENPSTIVSEITNTLYHAAEECGLKKKRIREKQGKDPPWFDKECLILKSKIRELAKLIKKSPHNKEFKENLYNYKRQFKNTTRRKKTSYKEDILNQLNCNNKSSKQFWKTLDKLNPIDNDNLIKLGITGQRWLDHFKSIFVSDTTKPFPINPSEIGPLD